MLIIICALPNIVRFLPLHICLITFILGSLSLKCFLGYLRPSGTNWDKVEYNKYNYTIQYNHFYCASIVDVAEYKARASPVIKIKVQDSVPCHQKEVGSAAWGWNKIYGDKTGWNMDWTGGNKSGTGWNKISEGRTSYPRLQQAGKRCPRGQG